MSAFYSQSISAIGAYTIVDPTKTSNKNVQTAEEAVSSTTDQLLQWGRYATDVKTFWNETYDDVSLTMAKVQLENKTEGGVSNAALQAEYQPVAGMCDYLSVAARAVEEDDGCSIYYVDETESDYYPVYEGQASGKSLPISRLERMLERTQEREESQGREKPTNYEDAAIANQSLYFDVMAGPSLTEITAKDRESMDSFIEMAMGHDRFELKNHDSSSAKYYNSVMVQQHARQTFLFGVSQMSYLRRSQNEEYRSTEGDMWEVKANIQEYIEGLSKSDVEGFVRPSESEIIRQDTIKNAQNLKFQYSELLTRLINEMTLALKSQVLNEVNNNVSR